MEPLKQPIQSINSEISSRLRRKASSMLISISNNKSTAIVSLYKLYGNIFFKSLCVFFILGV